MEWGFEMTDYNDGKIHGWNGGPCPVHPKAEVMFWTLGSGSGEAVAENLRWSVGESCSCDIIAFQVVKVHFEPKTIWVNEYSNGDVFSYCTEDGAKHHARTSATRIAVKYVEVKE